MAKTRAKQRVRWRRALDGVAAVSMIVAALTIVSRDGGGTKPAPPPLPSAPLSLDGLALKGHPLAPAGMILYSDFQCPFCRRFAIEVFPVVDRDLIASGRLQVAFAHLPLESIHPQAVAAASLAECSRLSGQFWATHDALFAVPPPLTVDGIDALAGQLEGECTEADVLRTVREHQRQAEALGVVSTPTFLVGPMRDGRLVVREVLRGLQSAEALRQVVERFSS